MSFGKLLGAGLVLAVGALSPLEAHPRLMRPYAACRPFHARPHGMFNTCCAPIHNPCCPPVFVDPCNPCVQPMMQTTLQPQQVITYQTVPQVQYQRQTYVENVPVVSYQNVTVDEGGYQMVWVPRPVQKQVAQTVLQPQVRYRDVAVQVNQQVAQVQTQLVPQQTLSYVPQTMQVGTQYMGTQIIGWQPGGVPVIGAYPAVPMTSALPGMAPIPDSAGTVNRLVPQPQSAEMPAGDQWSTIRQRQGTAPVNTSAIPSAAAVWQSQLQTGVMAR